MMKSPQQFGQIYHYSGTTQTHSGFCENPEKQTVVSGTLFEDLDLPETVTVVLSDGSTEKAGVVWEKDGYLPEVGTYTISGILTLPDGVENPENLQAEATVVVEEQELSPHLFFVQWNAKQSWK